MTKPPPVLSSSLHEQPLRFEESGLSWAGHAGAEPASPLVRFHLPATTPEASHFRDVAALGDVAQIDEGLARWPLPWGLLEALARRSLERQPDEVAQFLSESTRGDPRWRRALLVAAGGKLASSTRAAAPRLLHRSGGELRLDGVLAVGDEGVAVLERLGPGRARLAFVGGASPWSRDVEGAGDPWLALLPPLLGAVAPRRVVVSAHWHHEKVARLWVLTAEGELLATAAYPCSGAPRAVVLSDRAALVRLGGDQLLVELDPVALPEPGPLHATPPGAPRPPRLVASDWAPVQALFNLVAEVGGHVALPLQKRLTFVQLATGQQRDGGEWPKDAYHAAAAGGSVWASSGHSGLWRFRPGEAAVQVRAGSTGAMTSSEDRLFVSVNGPAGARLVMLEPSTGELLREVALPGFVSAVAPLPGGVAVLSDAQVCRVSSLGEVVLLGRVAAGAFALRTSALPAGQAAVRTEEDLWVLDAAGKCARHHRAGWVQLLGTAADTFLVATHPRETGNGWDSILAIGADGAVRATLAGARWLVPERAFAEGRTERDLDGGFRQGLLRFQRARLEHWVPGEAKATALELPTPAPPLPVLRGVHVSAGETYSPRDDVPTAGLAVSGTSQLAVDSTFQGTTGVAPGPDVEASDGAMVVLERCTVRSVVARGRSTVLLLGGSQGVDATAEPGSFVVEGITLEV